MNFINATSKKEKKFKWILPVFTSVKHYTVTATGVNSKPSDSESTATIC